MQRRYLYSILLSTLFIAFSCTKTEAVSIKLEDQEELNTISVIVDSEGEIIPGVDLDIIVSDYTDVHGIYQNNDLCKMAFSGDFNDNVISIECLNDLETSMNGVISTFKYVPYSGDYSFYINQENLDIGDFPLTVVSNINYSNEIVIIEEESEQNIEDDDNTLTRRESIKNSINTTLDTLLEFLKKYSIYLLEGTVLLILVIILISLLTEKENENEEEYRLVKE
jgi:hypothetical protein